MNMYNWKTLETPKKGEGIAIFRHVDGERDLVKYTTVVDIKKHIPFSDLYTFSSKSGKVYTVKRIHQ